MSTPAQDKGIIVNVTRLKISNKEHARYGDGLIYILTEDDGTRLPFFKSECGTIGCECFFVDDFSIIPDTPRVAITVDFPAPVAPALTMQEALAAPLPVVPVASPYTALQALAIKTFETMYEHAVAHREGGESHLIGTYGICDNISRFSDMASANYSQMAEVKENLIRTTASYSGDYTYPVKGVNGRDASNSFSFFDNKWQGEYGLNRLNQLGELVDILKSDKWSDDLVNRQTPAKRHGLKVGDIVKYTHPGRYENTLWVLREDDASRNPSFYRLSDKDDWTDLSLEYIVKAGEELVKARSVSEFLSELEAQTKVKEDLDRQIAELTKQLQNVVSGIALLDYGLADQHKVKRIS